MANKHRMIIRADGGTGIGMGHIMRTLVLADLLKQHVDIIYVCNKDYITGIQFLREKGYDVLSFMKDNLLEELISIEAACLLTDNYEIDQDYVSKVRNHFKVVGYIDDNALLTYEADFILNQNFGAQYIDYNVNNDCELFLGSEYLLVREAFRNKSIKTVRNGVKQVLITVGGSDDLNLMSKLLQMVWDMDFKFNIVVGPMFPYEQDMIIKYGGLKNIVIHKQPDMTILMLECDMAISSCGSTLYELGLLGIPTIGISIADNQIPLANRMHSEGLIEYVGEINTLKAGILRENLLELAKDYGKRNTMNRLNQEMFNARGAERAAKRIYNMMGE